MYRKIDWDKGVEFLEQELHEIVKTRFRGAKICDKLAKVWLEKGKELWVLTHIEIEANPKKSFPKRPYWYRILLFDKYKTENIYTMVIYPSDASLNQAGRYEHVFEENRALFEFPVYKIWEEDKTALETSENIFSLFVLAQQFANELKDDMNKRLVFREKLFDLALEKKIPQR